MKIVSMTRPNCSAGLTRNNKSKEPNNISEPNRLMAVFLHRKSIHRLRKVGRGSRENNRGIRTKERNLRRITF